MSLGRVIMTLDVPITLCVVLISTGALVGDWVTNPSRALSKQSGLL